MTTLRFYSHTCPLQTSGGVAGSCQLQPGEDVFAARHDVGLERADGVLHRLRLVRCRRRLHGYDPGMTRYKRTRVAVGYMFDLRQIRCIFKCIIQIKN